MYYNFYFDMWKLAISITKKIINILVFYEEKINIEIESIFCIRIEEKIDERKRNNWFLISNRWDK